MTKDINTEEMNITEAKALFFAQYYGQKIQYSIYDKEDAMFVGSTGFSWHLIDTDYLLLRTVEQLTDEESLILAYLAQYHPSIEDYQKDDVWIGECDTCPDGGLSLEIGCRCWQGKLRIEPDFHIWLENEDDSMYKEFVYNTLAIHDYLRSIGILLPFTYLDENKTPTILSIEQIIKLGWAKLM